MKKEIDYSSVTDSKHIKKLGQYFTKYEVADFMCKWACEGADNMLDPAVGNSVFFAMTDKYYANCKLEGYEIDNTILEYFGNPTNANIHVQDYLFSDWEKKYDAIVCNPPYNRFQSVKNRDQVLDIISENTGIKYSGYTNQYILFLIKSIYQMSERGRLAYIIPTEFLNSQYGTPIKEKLIEEKLIRAIVNFENNDDMFFNATTTCCVLLLDKTEKEEIRFYNISSIGDLDGIIENKGTDKCISVAYDAIKPEQKWRIYLNHEGVKEYTNLKEMSAFCTVSRGIATGANDFFCMSKTDIQKLGLPESAMSKCICRSADVKKSVFREEDYEKLVQDDKTVYLLDIKDTTDENVKKYVEKGESEEVNKKYLLSCRKPWFSMEQKPVAPIWVSSACREGIKFVRNLAGVKSLTTFHSIFINDKYKNDVDLIFCYFLTPIAQSILRENRKELGNGLDKFQPNDLKTAMMLDLNVISDDDREKIRKLYDEIREDASDESIDSLNEIFSAYLLGA